MNSDTSLICREILTLALARGATVSTAESCTGGKIASALTDLPGASDIFHRGYVTYSNAAKIDMLGVHAETLEAFGAVSEAVVREMALGARELADATIAIAVSGIAGPGGSEHKPEGRVCFGLSTPDVDQAETVDFGPHGRDYVRQAACDHALDMVLNFLRNTPRS